MELDKATVSDEKKKMEAKLKLIAEGNPEILAELQKDKFKKTIRVEMQDGKIVANYEGRADGLGYEEFKKIHNSFNEFISMARKWFGLENK